MLVFIRTVLLATFGLIFAIIAGLASTPERVVVERPQMTEQVASPTTTPPQTITASSSAKTEVKAKVLPKTITTTPKVQAPLPIVQAPTAPLLSSSALNDLVRGSIVNIICTTATGGSLNSISASGVMIEPRGVIITNAHVGQYFLLKDYPRPNFVECIIRTGSPATPKYTAELLFLPPSWIEKNASKINDDRPTGNGEYDYALLRITGSVNPKNPVPSSFPFLRIAITAPDEGQPALVAGYPAGFLGGITVQKELYASSATTHIGELFTFVSETVDLFSLGGTVVSQQGSSGGAATNSDGTLIGVIATASDGTDTASRDLRAISTRYIIESFQKESGVSLASYLNGDLIAEARDFQKSVAPGLTATLISAIEKP